MIQGQINSMIAQIGNMAHLGATLNNKKKALDNEKKVGAVAERVVNNEKQAGAVAEHITNSEKSLKNLNTNLKYAGARELKSNYALYGSTKRVVPEMARELIKLTDEYDYKGAGLTTRDWDRNKASMARFLTAEQLANMDEQRAQMRKPSTVKAPGGKNNGKQE